MQIPDTMLDDRIAIVGTAGVQHQPMQEPEMDQQSMDFLLGQMKIGARDAFVLCKETAEHMADSIAKGELPDRDPQFYLRLLASMFAASAKTP